MRHMGLALAVAALVGSSCSSRVSLESPTSPATSQFGRELSPSETSSLLEGTRARVIRGGASERTERIFCRAGLYGEYQGRVPIRGTWTTDARGLCFGGQLPEQQQCYRLVRLDRDEYIMTDASGLSEQIRLSGIDC